jgi:uncharacterized protein (DUF433 family)
MPDSTTTLKGIIHGMLIELEREPGMPDGQEVNVEIRPVAETPRWLERFDVDPTVQPGKLVVRGTRLLAEDLARLLEEGRSDEEMLRQFPELAAEDMAAVRQYACVPAGLRRAFGAWADDPEGVDHFVEWTYRQRTLDRPLLEPCALSSSPTPA